MDLFARRGFDGASVRAITRRAGANLGAVTYHFGSKRALYDAALHSRLGPLQEAMRTAADAPGAAPDRVERLLRTFFGFLAEHPEIPRLMLQETASGRVPPAAALGAIRGILGTIVGVIAEGQREGSVREGDPVLMAISIVAQPIHLTLIHRLAAEAVALDQEDPDTRARVVAHAVAFARAGLARPPGGRS